MNTGRKTINVTLPKMGTRGFWEWNFGQKVHVPFGTKGTHFGEYRTKNSFGQKKKERRDSFGNTGKGLIIKCPDFTNYTASN